MDNKTIAKYFDQIAKLMELHQQNPFKIRTYANAYQSIARSDQQLIGLDLAALIAVPGIGKTLAQNIIELKEKGTITVLDQLIAMTPPGILDVLKIKGLGAKKIAQIWNELAVESLGELEYACLENRLVGLKGFGEKTQTDILNQIDFLRNSKGAVLLPVGMEYGENVLKLFRQLFPHSRFEITGSLKRKMEVVRQIDIAGTIESEHLSEKIDDLDDFSMKDGLIHYKSIPVTYQFSQQKDFQDNYLLSLLPESFNPDIQPYSMAELQNIPAECLDLIAMSNGKKVTCIDNLLDFDDIKGVIHAHSSWSDGNNTVEEMAVASKEAGYQYLLLTDHSASAFYANGLTEDRVLQQWREIDKINERWPDFKVFKGIESDILTDGRLDYRDDFITGFEVVIASVHSVLKMDENTATVRLIKAIEHPSTRILGHLTGRLLLSRSGYPVDHKKIIDACAANRVVIEINANPHRLDLDWRWLPYAMERGVGICLSPDAHHIRGIKDLVYGVWMARKGGLVKDSCLNTKDRQSFENWVSSK